MQSKKSILNHVLCFIHRESKTHEISEQRSVQFAIQGSSLTVAGRKPRERQHQRYGIATHTELPLLRSPASCLYSYNKLRVQFSGSGDKELRGSFKFSERVFDLAYWDKQLSGEWQLNGSRLRPGRHPTFHPDGS